MKNANLFAFALVALSVPVQAANLDLLRVTKQGSGDWLRIDGVLSGGTFDYFTAVISCNGEYVGNETAKVEANNTFSMNVFDVPNDCVVVRMSRPTVTRISRYGEKNEAVDMSAVPQAFDANSGMGMSVVGKHTDPARRGMDRHEIIAVQEFLGVPADGAIGPKTMAAVEEWNETQGIEHIYISEHLVARALEKRSGRRDSGL